jgi:uncharacterized membrane protein YbhN (UPF0104 family)
MISVLAALAIYLLALFFSDPEQSWSGLRRLSLGKWGLVLSFPLCNYLLRFVRWHWYLSSLGNSVPVGLDLRVYLAGFSLTTTPGKVGETIRSLLLHSEQVSYEDSMAAFVAERFTDLLAVAMLAMLASVQFEGYRWLISLSLAVLLLSFWLLRSPTPDRWLASRPGGSGWLSRALLGGMRTLRACRVLLSSRLLLGGLFLAGIGWALEGVAYWVVLDALGVSVDVAAAVGIYSVATLAGALSFIPGGLGAMEGILSGFLLLIGTSTADAISSTVIIRVATLWFAVAIGVLAMTTLLGRRTPSEHPKQRGSHAH